MKRNKEMQEIHASGPNQPFKDAITVFKYGNLLINRFKEKYGVSYRAVIIRALMMAHNKQLAETVDPAARSVHIDDVMSRTKIDDFKNVAKELNG